MKKILLLTFSILILLHSCVDQNKEAISTFSKNAPSFPIDEIVMNGISQILTDNGNKKDEFGDICGSEFEEPRTYHFLDINNDDNNDLLIFMTIERLGCGNDYSYFLLTSLNENDKYSFNNIAKVGGKGSRYIDFEFLSVKGDSLYFQSIEYGPDDPMCCPSLENKIALPLENFINNNI